MDQPHAGRRRRIGLGKRGIVLARIRRARRAIDQRAHLGVVAHLGDDLAAIGMGNEDGRAVLACERAAGIIAILRQRVQRVLNRSDVQSMRLKPRNDFAPAGAIRIGPMHEHDIAGTR